MKADFDTILFFSREITDLRLDFPEFARELDGCLLEILNNYTPKCGKENCTCQTMDAEQFHAERNLQLRTFEKTK